MINVNINDEKNGIEIRFDEKPSKKTLDLLKQHGFRWSQKQHIWYAKQTEERIKLATGLANGNEDISTEAEDNAINANCKYDLWEMTRISDDVNNVDKKLTTKEIAAIARKHIKTRFPMCRFSITCDTDSIRACIMSGPFGKDSDELNAIAHYVYKYISSYNYCTCHDPYGDYGSSYNFYGVYENDIISWEYAQRDMSVSERNMADDFQMQKAAFDKAEALRKEREMQERIEKEKVEREQYKIREEIRNKNHETIESNAEVVDIEEPYFVLNCIATNTAKEDSVDDYFDDYDGDVEIKYVRENCNVSREVHFKKEIYDKFANQLLDDYSFLTGKGGTKTDDLRIGTWMDYELMSEAERKTVEAYCNDCIAIFCDHELKLIIDPQGYNYARYVYFVDDRSSIEKNYTGNIGISKEEYEENLAALSALEDVSANIIIDNGWIGTWYTEHFDEYKQLMKDWIYSHDFKFHVGVIRAISEGGNFKTAMYRLLKEMEGIQEQFIRADLNVDQKVTIIQISDFGGISTTRGKFKKFELGKYAQYDNAIKFVYRPQNKRSDYYCWFYRDVLIYDGWLEVPESLLWDISFHNGILCKKSKFLSCDRKQYDVILDYFAGIGKTPIVNTCKNLF